MLYISVATHSMIDHNPDGITKKHAWIDSCDEEIFCVSESNYYNKYKNVKKHSQKGYKISCKILDEYIEKKVAFLNWIESRWNIYSDLQENLSSGEYIQIGNILKDKMDKLKNLTEKKLLDVFKKNESRTGFSIHNLDSLYLKNKFELLQISLKEYALYINPPTSSEKIIFPPNNITSTDFILNYIETLLYTNSPQIWEFHHAKYWAKSTINSDQQLLTCVRLQHLAQKTFGPDFTFGIESIELNHMQLNQDALDFIGKLPRLKTLKLTGNKISTSQISLLLDNLSKGSTQYTLEYLDLSDSNLTDENIHSIVQFKNLKTLYLTRCLCVFESEWNKFITSLTSKIEHLSLEDVVINSSTAILIAKKFQHLNSINLSSCPDIDSSAWIEIISLLNPNIESININDTYIDHRGLLALTNHNNIKHLELNESQYIDSEFWKEIFEILPTSINSLSLHECNIPDYALFLLSRFNQLEYLCLPNNNFLTGIELKKHLLSLEEKLIEYTTSEQLKQNKKVINDEYSQEDVYRLLNIGPNSSKIVISYMHTKIPSATILHYLPENTERIFFSWGKLDPKETESLSKLNKLKEFSITGTKFYPEENRDYLDHLPDTLEKLFLNETNTTGKFASSLKKFKKLNSIGLSGNKITTENWHHILSSLNDNIKSISFNGGSSYSGENSCLLKKFKNLKFLDLGHCKLPPNNWHTLLESLPKSLQYLNLSFTNYQGENHCHFIRLIHLKELKLGSVKLQPEAWAGIVSHLPCSLVELDLQFGYLDGSTGYYQGENCEEFIRLSKLEDLNLFRCKMPEERWDWLSCSLPESINRLQTDGSNIPFQIHLDNVKLINKSLRKYLNSDDLSLAGVSLQELNDGTLKNAPETLTSLHISILNCFSADDSLGNHEYRHLSKFKNLKKISISNIDIDSDIESIFMYYLPENITHLSLSNTSLSGSFAESLTRFNKLDYFELSNSRYILLENATTIFNSLPSTIETIISDISTIGTDPKVFSRFSNLKCFSYSYGAVLKPEEWMDLLNSLPDTLEVLDLSNTGYAGEAAKNFRRFKNLTDINLYSCKMEPDKWQVILSSLPYGVRLNFSNSNCPYLLTPYKMKQYMSKSLCTMQ